MGEEERQRRLAEVERFTLHTGHHSICSQSRKIVRQQRSRSQEQLRSAAYQSPAPAGPYGSPGMDFELATGISARGGISSSRGPTPTSGFGATAIFGVFPESGTGGTSSARAGIAAARRRHV